MTDRTLHRIAGKGLTLPDERVYAVITVGANNDTRYVLRQVCRKGEEGYENAPYGFPATNRCSEETIEETAERSARQWGFEADSVRHIHKSVEKSRSGVETRQYVWCKCPGNDYSEELIFEDPNYRSVRNKDQNARRALRLFTVEDATENPMIKAEVPALIRLVDFMINGI